MAEDDDSELIPPHSAAGGKFGRAALNALGGLVPFVGGVFQPPPACGRRRNRKS